MQEDHPAFDQAIEHRGHTDNSTANRVPACSYNGHWNKIRFTILPPDIIDHETSTDMVVREGSNVTFRCSATGSPAPNITWRREDGQIFLGNDQKVSPMIWIQNQLVGARVGQSMTLECQSEAYPKSINYWTKDKAEIIAQDGRYEPIFTDNAYKVTMKLTIRSVTPADFGTYKCVSRNSLGDTDGSIKLYEITSGNEHGTRGEDSEYRGK
ncbi:hypothetical protein PV326_013623 [Microctonus aethiopoides]|nr:hypothetical protein PV326_013623 [Microctonus aethiopoides]